MDEMHIKTLFTKKIITKIIYRLLESKLGITPNIDLGDIDIFIGEENVDVGLSFTVRMKKSQVGEMVSKLM